MWPLAYCLVKGPALRNLVEQLEDGAFRQGHDERPVILAPAPPLQTAHGISISARIARWHSLLCRRIVGGARLEQSARVVEDRAAVRFQPGEPARPGTGAIYIDELPVARPGQHRTGSCSGRHLCHPRHGTNGIGIQPTSGASLQRVIQGRACVPQPEECGSQDPAHSSSSGGPRTGTRIPLHVGVLRRVAHASSARPHVVSRRRAGRRPIPRIICYFPLIVGGNFGLTVRTHTAAPDPQTRATLAEELRKSGRLLRAMSRKAPLACFHPRLSHNCRDSFERSQISRQPEKHSWPNSGCAGLDRETRGSCVRDLNRSQRERRLLVSPTREPIRSLRQTLQSDSLLVRSPLNVPLWYSVADRISGEEWTPRWTAKREVGGPTFSGWAWCPFWCPFFDQTG